MSKRPRLDQALVAQGLVASRSQAESYIRLGKVSVNNKVATNPGLTIREGDQVKLAVTDQYVGRAGLKLAGAAVELGLSFRGKTVLDVGSSTGGFTDYALQQGARGVIAVDVGTKQLHPKLLGHPAIELHEKTDIRDFWPTIPLQIVVIDVSFISLRDILPHIADIAQPDTQIVVMVKPQFEAPARDLHAGVIKNDRIRRTVLRDFEVWAQARFMIRGKADSAVPGAKGNRERFYLLQPLH